jgi:signal transduction histidine kinase
MILEYQIHEATNLISDKNSIEKFKSFNFKLFTNSKKGFEACLKNKTILVLEGSKLCEKKACYYRILFRPKGKDEVILKIEETTDYVDLDSKKLIKREEKKLIKNQLLAIDIEGKKIAEKIHNGLSQSLTIINMNLEALRRNVLTINKEQLEILNETLNVVDIAIVESRKLAAKITPIKITKGLVAAIKSEVIKLNEKTDIKFNFFQEDSERRYDNYIENNLYNIVKESIEIIRNYSNPSIVDIQLIEVDGLLILIIEDDGVIGFYDDMTNEEIEISLNNIKSRVYCLNADLFIEAVNNIHIRIEVKLIDKK